MFAKGGAGGKDNIDITVPDCVPALPSYVIVWFVRGVIGVCNHSVLVPNTLQPVNILLNYSFTFGINDLADSFFGGCRHSSWGASSYS